MKSLIACLLLVLCGSCQAANKLFSSSLEWAKASLPQELALEYDAEGLSFSGCKQREYQLRLTQPLTSRVSLDTTVGFAKGKLDWGVFSQKVSVYEFAVIPRYQLTDDLTLGMGVIAQSEVRFKAAHGKILDLPRSTEWLAVARISGLAEQHYWEIKFSSQKYAASNVSDNWFDQGIPNHKLNLEYVGYF